MKYIYITLCSIFSYFFSVGALGQNVYEFTTCGATGRFGPTQAEANTEYASTNLSGSVVIIGDGIQRWTAPGSGTYKIKVCGARGGNCGTYTGGLGACMEGEFQIGGGQTLDIIVGQMGEDIIYNTGGGGGSFVWKTNETIEPLIAAGGGGGAGYSANGGDASITTSGTNGSGAAGTTGTGGYGAIPGGGGWKGVGTDYNSGASCAEKCPGAGLGITHGGATPLTTIGYHGCAGSSQTGDGGFGGASGGNGNCTSSHGGGGGGGYSGGVGQTGSSASGGGGGSYNEGTNQNNLTAAQNGDGYVIIEYLGGGGPNDAGITSIESPATGACAGTYPLEVVVNNSGTNQITAVNIEWTINGGSTSTFSYSGTLDTLGGVGSTSAEINLGNITINGNTAIKVWTTMPNGNPDTVNLNDTNEIVFYASDPQIDLGQLALCDGNFEIINVADPQWNTYEWNTGSTDPQIVVTSPGMYAITVVDTFNCPATDSVDVQNGVTPVVNLGTELEDCDEHVLNAGTPNGTYEWSTTETTQTITVTESGNYFVTVTSEHGCIGEGGVGVTIHESPEIDLGSDQTICVDLGESALLGVSNIYETYQWSTGQASNAIVINGSQGWPLNWNEFYLTVIDENGCLDSDTARVRLKTCIPAGISDVIINNGFIAYPNPTSDDLTVQFTDNLSGSTIQLRDVTGRVVSSYSQTSSIEIIDVRNLNSGIYYLNVISDDRSYVQEIIIN